MPIGYSVSGRTLVLSLAGTYTTEELRALAGRIAADPAVPKRFHLLVDARHSASAPSAPEIEWRARTLLEMRERHSGRVAVVVSDDLRFGLARVLEAHLEGHGIEVRPFRDFAAAEEWLRSAPE